MTKTFTGVPYQYLGVQPKTAATFFVVFSRFEYALKFAKFRKSGRRADPSWNDFGTAIADAFDAALAADDTQLRKAAEYLLKHPPNVQVVENGRLDWDAFKPQRRDDPRTAHVVLDAVKQVRNNLFHGGKYFDSQAPRDKRLIAASMVVLEACVSMNAEVHDAYFDNA